MTATTTPIILRRRTIGLTTLEITTPIQTIPLDIESIHLRFLKENTAGTQQGNAEIITTAILILLTGRNTEVTIAKRRTETRDATIKTILQETVLTNS